MTLNKIFSLVQRILDRSLIYFEKCQEVIQQKFNFLIKNQSGSVSYISGHIIHPKLTIFNIIT